MQLKPFRTSIRRQMANEAYELCCRLISEDSRSVPAHQMAWKIGQTFSWHYVKNVEYRVGQFYQTVEDWIIMAKPKKKASQNDFQAYSFVRCELNSEDKKAAKVWIEENTTELGAKVHDVVASDYKFSLSFSSEHDTFTACLVGKEDNAINPRKTLTARHKDWIVASLTVLYKHEVIFSGSVWEMPDTDEDDGWA